MGGLTLRKGYIYIRWQALDWKLEKAGKAKGQKQHRVDQLRKNYRKKARAGEK